ncbi:hypothetical protein JCM9140_1890 [Halalkalibacter wakoensis JCM 9140]|uniref:Uncharacterized protein n=1 Tax=Halalkalibacter wakoensis JCM 9140 TaxID=1236970 RepID=W4Q3B2_9BACI|nr:DUF5342 family protein [Halalkalibacter wakoensis]GAE25869.1 hypothetical protein JCM9140_1890 [Halalkalibacter wakoensis JCM 9140]
MIHHFQWKEIQKNVVRSEWAFSFYYGGSYYTGIYHKDGSIDWGTMDVDVKTKEKLEPLVHDLMLYHVYEKH